MAELPYDWTQFKKKIYINANIEQVFQAWAIPENIIKWFIAEADYVTEDNTPRPATDIVQAGDRYYWKWHQDLETEGLILEVVENESLKFTFGNKEENSDEKILVTVSLSEDGENTLLELTQENMADTPQAHVSWHMQCNLGWSFFITNLKGFLEYGVDLRETDPDRAYDSRAVTHPQ